MEDFFNTLTSKLQLYKVETNEFYGERSNQPLVLTYLNTDPPAIMFKIRVNVENKNEIDISECNTELSSQNNINISVENGYGWLTIYNIEDYTSEEVIVLLDMFLQILVENHLNLDTQCAICHNNEDTIIYYSENKVNKICETCSDLVEQQRLEKERRLSRLKYIYSIFIPVGIIIFALGWVFFWFIHDMYFVLSGTNSIDLTDIALVGISFLAAVIMSWPVGFVLKKLYIWKHALLVIISSSLVLIGFLLGEIIYLSILIYKEFGIINIIGIIHSLPYFWKENPEGVLIVKFLILICSAFIIYFVAKAKKPTVEI